MKRKLKRVLSTILCSTILLLNGISVEAHNLNPTPYTFNELQPDLVLLNNSMNVNPANAGKEISISFSTELRFAVNIGDRGYDGVSYSYNIETADNIGINAGPDGLKILIPSDAREGDSYDIKLTLSYIELQILREQPFVYDVVSEIPPVESEIFTINIIGEGNPGGSVSQNGIQKEETRGELQYEAPAYKAPTEAEIHAMKAAEVEARQKKTVATSSGTAVKTEIAGVYEIESLSGSAVTTAKADVLKAVGLTEEEILSGTNASIYMSGYLSKADKEVVTTAVQNSGKTALTMLISDMYTITKEGKITKLNNIPNPVSLLFGIPKYVIDADRTYSVLCVQPDGSYIELKDMDNDPGTITIDTTVFGKYVIVY